MLKSPSSDSMSFLKGAAALTLSGGAVKLLGAVYRILLTNYLGAAAMGWYSSAYSVYLFLFSLSSAGIPAGISAVISRSVATGSIRDAEKAFRLSAALFSVAGLILSVIGCLCAYPLATLMNGKEAFPALAAVMPSVFFVTAAAVFKGYFQGLGSMRATSVSNLIEGAAKTALGFFCALYCLKKGYSDSVAVGGAMLGVTSGTVLSLLYMIFKYLTRDRDAAVSVKGFLTEKLSSGRELIKKLAASTLPVTAASVTTSLMGAVDAFTVMNRLRGYLPDGEAQLLWGAYGNMTMTLFNLPAFLISAMGISLIPAVAAGFAGNNGEKARSAAIKAFTVSSVIAFASAFGLAVLSEPILTLLFPGQTQAVKAAAPLLSVISVSVISVGMTNISAAVLQAAGDAPFTAVSVAVGCAVKTAATFLLVSVPGINILGAAVATDIAYPVILAMNLARLRAKTGLKLSFTGIFAKPFAAGLLMAVCAFLTFSVLTRLVPSRFIIMPCIILSGIVYIALIQLFKIMNIYEFIRIFRKA